MSAGERGPTGDHGQDGKVGPEGAVGPEGQTGSEGARGKDAFSRKQTAVACLFILFAFLLLAYRAEMNAREIRDGVARHDQFVNETCALHPEFAPRTCERK